MANKAVKEKVNNSEVAYRKLVRPVITEATTAAMALNKYIFEVSKDATKKEIGKAVEELYNVTVEKVNTTSLPAKRKQYGRTPGWKPGMKKAVVTIKQGDKIELFEGV